MADSGVGPCCWAELSVSWRAVNTEQMIVKAVRMSLIILVDQQQKSNDRLSDTFNSGDVIKNKCVTKTIKVFTSLVFSSGPVTEEKACSEI